MTEIIYNHVSVNMLNLISRKVNNEDDWIFLPCYVTRLKLSLQTLRNDPLAVKTPVRSLYPEII